jgi:predicted DNA binding protein
MMEVVLIISMPDSWISKVSEDTAAKIKLIECIPDKNFGGRLLFEIEAEPDNISQVLKKIKAYEQICRLDISPYKKGGYLGSIITNNCITCKALTQSSCFLSHAINLTNAKVEWHLIMGEEKSLEKLISVLEMNGCIVELKSKTHLGKKTILTSKQEEIIKIAFERGYFDYPKKITLRELSKILKISFSTLNEILHRGEKKIIQNYYLKM